MPELQTCVGASGGSFIFPWQPPRKEEKMADTYRVKIKDGDYGYNNGVYGQHDYVADYATLAEALQDFLEWINGNEDDKVTLQFRPGKGE